MLLVKTRAESITVSNPKSLECYTRIIGLNFKNSIDEDCGKSKQYYLVPLKEDGTIDYEEINNILNSKSNKKYWFLETKLTPELLNKEKLRNSILAVTYHNRNYYQFVDIDEKKNPNSMFPGGL